ncbi:hypothetical protein FACS1894162_4020 [Bacteroidia bacterium]|nr:hypothetical protein FACS1894162_4020 [Bacteroidia bacterium]
MRKLLLILSFAIPLTGFAQVSFKGTAPNAVVIGEQFQVKYIISSSGDRPKEPRLAEPTGLKVLYGPTLSGQSTSTFISNGNRSSQTDLTYTYVLMAEKAGDYTIPAATVKVGDTEYKSNALNIKALPADQVAAANNQAAQAQQDNSANNSQGSSGDVFIRMNVSKSSVYENEGFLVTFKLYSLVDINGFESVKFPEFEGFVAQEIELPDNKQMQLENYNGRNYRTVVLKQTILYPQRAGKITIGQGKFETSIRVRTQAQRPRSFFDDFFDSYTNIKKTVYSSPTTIDVKALPAGKPASFNGAVGNYKMSSTISTTKLKANDPVTIKLSLSGNGNIKLIKNPEFVFPADFEVYDPKVDVKVNVSGNGASGTKTIEYYVVPRYAGNFTIPAAKFSYFDLKSGTYKTLSTEEYKLQVAPGVGGNGSAAIVSGTNKEDVRHLGEDIRHIHTGNVHFFKGSYFFGTLEYWLCYLLPLLAFVVLFIIYRKQAAANANIALMRTKKANKVAAKRLKLANKYLKENQREPFYDETLKAVWGYLSDKLSIPVANLTKDNVELELVRYGVSENLISKFMKILNTAEFARFAPSQGHEAMDDLYNSTVKAIDKMENIVKS